MTEPAFLANEDFRADIIHATLRVRPDIDLVNVHQLLLKGATDADLLEIAFSSGRSILSHDVNIMINAAQARMESGLSIAGLLMASQSASRKAVAETIVLISKASNSEDWHNIIDFLPW